MSITFSWSSNSVKCVVSFSQQSRRNGYPDGQMLEIKKFIRWLLNYLLFQINFPSFYSFHKSCSTCQYFSTAATLCCAHTQPSKKAHSCYNFTQQTFWTCRSRNSSKHNTNYCNSIKWTVNTHTHLLSVECSKHLRVFLLWHVNMSVRYIRRAQ